MNLFSMLIEYHLGLPLYGMPLGSEVLCWARIFSLHGEPLGQEPPADPGSTHSIFSEAQPFCMPA